MPEGKERRATGHTLRNFGESTMPHADSTTDLRPRASAWAALGTAAILALTACGESAADSDDGGGDAEAAGEEDGDTDSDADSDLEDVDADDDVIRITGVPAEEATELESKFDLLLEVFEDRLDREVEFHPSTSYAAVIEALRAGQADLALGSPFSYVRAGDQGVEVEPLGGRVAEEGDPAGYYAYALTTPDSDISSLEDVEGRSVCYVDPASTSGYLYPSAGMIDAGLDPEDDVDADFLGSHDAAVLAVLDGQCEVAFAYDGMVEVQMPQRGELDESDYDVIWESPRISASPIYMNLDTLDEDVQDELRGIFDEELINVDALTEAGYCDDAEDCELPEDAYEYTPIDDGEFDGVREVCEITQAEACDE